MNAILLSAGFGRRFLPHTKTQAKPTIPFLNLPLICYSLYYAQKFQSKKLIVNTHHLPDSIENCVNRYKPSLNCQVSFLNEHPSILDSGGGIKNAQNFLEEDEHFFVFNTDIPHLFPNFDFSQALKEHIQNEALATIITCDLPGIGDKVSGVWTPQDSFEIADFGLGPKSNLRCRHYTGLMILSQAIFKYQPESKAHNILYDVILPVIQEKKETAHCHHIDSLRWFETGNLQSYLQASFQTVDDLIDSPDSPTSKELKKISHFFEQPLFTFEDEGRRLAFSDKQILSSIDAYRGHIVSGSLPSFQDQQTITNSVIGQKVLKLPKSGPIHHQLIL